MSQPASRPGTDTQRPSAEIDSDRLRSAIDDVLSRDRGRLLKRWQALSRAPDPLRLAELAEAVQASRATRLRRRESVPSISLDAALPITEHAEQLVRLIRQHQIVVVAGETGSGKTTQLPKLCLLAGRGEAGLIGCTQPRRLAARSVAQRVAEELSTPLGQLVGFQVRFTDQVSDASLVKFMTDGILLAETQNDPWLSRYDTIIIDEAHERSLNIDFLLGYLKQLARRRPELKIVITSATIDTARFAEHFDGAPIVEIEGRTYPVEVRWHSVDEMPGDRQLQQGSPEHVAAVMDEISKRRGGGDDPLGDVLVFLPGEREIRDAHRLLDQRNYRETEVLPLYARLSAGDQDRIFKPGPRRRIVLATNVAETSLTVPRIRYVIDTGVARVKRYSQRSQMERLHVEPISQAAANQRKGRCGRIGPGICYRLYSEEDFSTRPAFTDPELLRSSLANVILRMLALKLGEVEDFPFIEAPDPRVVSDGYRRLAEISAIDEARHLTATGRVLARLPIDVQLARMLVEAEQRGCLRAMLAIVAFLSVQDPRERPADARPQADAAHAVFADPGSDFMGVLNLWRAYEQAHEDLSQSKLRDWCSRHFLSFLRMREWRELHRQLLTVVRELGWKPNASEMDAETSAVVERPVPSVPARSSRGRGGRRQAEAAPKERVQVPPSAQRQQARTLEQAQARVYEVIHRSLLAGLPTQVGHKDDKGVYRGTRERRFQVFPGSSVSKQPPAWLFASQIMDLGGKVWAMLCARVEPAWIEQQAAHLMRRSWREPHWSRQRGAVMAYEQVSLLGLVLAERRAVNFQAQDPALAHRLFVTEALARCDIDARADFVAANRKVLEQAEDVQARQRRDGLLHDETVLAGFFAGKLPESIASSRALDAWYARADPAGQAALRWTLDDVLGGSERPDARAFPAEWELGARRLRLEYRFVPGDEADGVTLQLPLDLLNAIPADRCEWLVPGLLSAKVAEMIRGLPKALRRNFVPAPDFARAFVEAESVRDEPLGKVLARFLTRATGVVLAPEAFAGMPLEAHFMMRFRLHDEKGRTLASSRDLEQLRADWEGRARDAFARSTDVELKQTEATQWDFDEIPGQIRSGHGVNAFPALVDMGSAVALRLFERHGEALATHRRGVARLLAMTLASELKHVKRRLPIKPALALKYAPIGHLDALREDLVEGAWHDLLAGHELNVRTADDFERLRRQLASALSAAAMERLKLAEPVIELQAELTPWLRPHVEGFARASYADLNEQAAHLLTPGFLRELPRDRLAHYPRYLKAMLLRAQRLRQDPGRDGPRMLQVTPYWRDYLKRLASGDDRLDELRWLIEEWRVSLFAQELKTAEPVSAKRLAKAQEALG
ncbi:ATP-dependent RNA helicase HrpA [Frateuria aurantia]